MLDNVNDIKRRIQDYNSKLEGIKRQESTSKAMLDKYKQDKEEMLRTLKEKGIDVENIDTSIEEYKKLANKLLHEIDNLLHNNEYKIRNVEIETNTFDIKTNTFDIKEKTTDVPVKERIDQPIVSFDSFEDFKLD